MIPLYGFVEGDTLGILLLAHEHETIRVIGERLAGAAAVRVKPRGVFSIEHKGGELALTKSIGQCGVEALDRLDLRWGAR